MAHHDDAVRHLLAARKNAALVHSHDVAPADEAGAYALQDATIREIGPAGGWKVGSKTADSPPGCSPLPASGMFPSGAKLQGPPWRMRGVEAEVAVRLGRSLDVGDRLATREELADAIEAVLPVIEVIETRLAAWKDSDPLAQLADMQNHGALVYGEPSTFKPQDIDLRQVQAYVAFDGQPVASTVGANPAGDVWRLLAWLARHCSLRGTPLREGQIVTTGSCSGMLLAPEGARVVAQLNGIGVVELTF